MKIKLTERQLKKVYVLLEDISVSNAAIESITSTLEDYLPISSDVDNYDGTTLLQKILVDSGYCVYSNDCERIDGDFGGTTKKSLESFMGKTSLKDNTDIEELINSMEDPNKIGPLKSEKSYSNTLDSWDKIIYELNWFKSNLEKELGKEYVWGSNGPSTFDCSGLIVGFYGVPDGRANTFYSKYGDDTITRDNVKIGDLVFFKTTELPAGHVGIVINTNNPNSIEFIHASGSECCTNWWKCGNKDDTDEVKKQKQIEKRKKSCVVRINNLNPSGYYGKKFVGFGSIPNRM